MKMKKKLGVIGTTLAIALAFNSVGASAAENNIDVFIDDKQVAFETAPFIEQGTTLVQFRPVFEKLGMEFKWNEQDRTVVAKKDNLEIKLQIGSKTATVNGKEVKLLQAPKIVNDRTFVPLRFLGEASAREVSWDGRTKTVYIADTEQQIKHLTELHLKYAQDEDMDGLMSTMDQSNPSLKQSEISIKSTFAAYDLKYELLGFELIEKNNNQATAKLRVKMTKVNGPEFKDRIQEITHNFMKNNGTWVVNEDKINKIEYLTKDDALKEEKVELSDADQKAILALIEQDRELTNKEDVEGSKMLRDSSYSNLEQMELILKKMYAAFDFQTTYDNVKIIQGKNDMAKVKISGTLKKVSGPEYPDFKLVAVTYLKKLADGKWKIVDEETVVQEFLD